MAIMSIANRTLARQAFTGDTNNLREPVNVTRLQLQAAIDAIDDWLNLNASALNAALPLIARNNLTTSQKARLLQYVVQQRFLAGA